MWLWIAFFAVIFFTAIVRVRLLGIPLERDEGEYAYTARLILQGIPPYIESYDPKIPGLHIVYALIMAVFGENLYGIHLGLLFTNISTIFVLFFMGKRLFGCSVGLISAAGFAIMSLSQNVLGFTANAEPLLLLPALGGIFIMLFALESDKKKYFFLSGFLVGLAFIIKQSALFFIIFPAFYIVYNYYMKHHIFTSRFVTRYLLFLFAVFIPFALVSIALLYYGTFDKFWFWTFKYALKYGSKMHLQNGFYLLKWNIKDVISTSFLIWGIAGIGVAALLWNKANHSQAVFMIAFLLSSFLSVSLGLYFRSHYFIMLLPAIALLFGIGTDFLGKMLPYKKHHLSKIATFVVAITAIFYSVYLEKAYLFQLDPKTISILNYGENPFVESLEIAKYIKKNSSTNDRIVVLGSEPQIYFYSNRLAATKYIVMYPMLKENEYALQMQKEMIAQIESAYPKFFIVVNIPTSFLIQPKAKRLIFKWAKSYVPLNFDLVGVVDILPKGTRYLWGSKSNGYIPQSSYWISIYKRKNNKN